MKCSNCSHPEWEHVEGLCEHKWIDDPRDSSHFCTCKEYKSSGEDSAWRTKTVTITVEIRTTADNEELAKAVTDYIQSGVFKAALSGALSGTIGDEFDIDDGAGVEVKDEK